MSANTDDRRMPPHLEAIRAHLELTGSANGGLRPPSMSRSNTMMFIYTGQHAKRIPRDITHVRVAPSVKRIGSGAFRHCHKIEEVELPEGVERIADGAFYDCTSLKYVYTIKLCKTKVLGIPSTVKVIGDCAFYGCEQLVDVHLQTGLERVGNRAFKGCKSLVQINIPSTTSVIDEAAFGICENLRDVWISEGVVRIKEKAFYGCKQVRNILIPSSVEFIGKETFLGCERLAEVVLSEGLEMIGGNAFTNCGSLKSVKIPSTVKVIGKWAFGYCYGLGHVELATGLEEIDESAFGGCSGLHKINIPSSVKKIGKDAFYDCTRLVSVELWGGIDIGRDAFQNFSSLRNIAAPPNERSPKYCEHGCLDLLRVFAYPEKIEAGLRNRFEGLPVHKLCYHQPFYQTETFIYQLKDLLGRPEHIGTSNAHQDVLGMTALHILAISSKHDLNVYQIILGHQSESLTTKDKWGCYPIFYAIWGNIPMDILHFLIENHKSTLIDFRLNWEEMIDTVCGAGVQLDIIKRIISTQQTFFPEQTMNWLQVANKMALCSLVRSTSIQEYCLTFNTLVEDICKAHGCTELQKCLREVQKASNLDQPSAFQSLCQKYVGHLEGWWLCGSPPYQSRKIFRFLVKSSVAERLDAIGVKKWRTEIKGLVKMISRIRSPERGNHLDLIHSKLTNYEHQYCQLKNATDLLEIALWQAEMKKSRLNAGAKISAEMRRQCRFYCGAYVIIPNVLQFLIPK